MESLRENIFTDKAELELKLAKEISQILQQEIKNKGEATLLVSGGSTPKKLYEILSNKEIDWKNVSIGLIDERFVDTETDESNELLIKNTLLINFNLSDLIAFSSISLVPPFATITGSSTIFFIFIFLIDLTTESITFVECNIPILIASGFISLELNII